MIGLRHGKYKDALIQLEKRKDAEPAFLGGADVGRRETAPRGGPAQPIVADQWAAGLILSVWASLTRSNSLGETAEALICARASSIQAKPSSTASVR